MKGVGCLGSGSENLTPNSYTLQYSRRVQFKVYDLRILAPPKPTNRNR